MKMADVRKKAKALGIKTSRKSKGDVIREIQAAEGNIVCFGKAGDHCDQHNCCWRDDCLPGPGKGKNSRAPSGRTPKA